MSSDTKIFRESLTENTNGQLPSVGIVEQSIVGLPGHPSNAENAKRKYSLHGAAPLGNTNVINLTTSHEH